MFWIPLVAMAVTAAATAYSGSQQANAAKKNAAAANSAQAAMQEDAQSQQWALQQESQRFQQEQDQIARDWQERMSNTAYQRSRQDMREAGLNPVLAATQGGATSMPVNGVGAGAPGSPMGSAHKAEAFNVLGPAVSAALQAAGTIQGLEATEQSISQSKAQEAVLRANERNIDVNTGLQVAQTMDTEQRVGLTKLLQDTERARQGALAADAGLAGSRTRAQDQETEHYSRYGYGQTGREASSIAGTGRQFGRSVSEVTREPAQAAGRAVGSSARALLDQWREQGREPSAAQHERMTDTNRQWRGVLERVLERLQ